jgi:hypothetical protein
MIIVVFFFLLRPGKYTANRSKSTPFRISGIQLFVGGQRLNLEDASDASIASATFATLMFTTQKNWSWSQWQQFPLSSPSHYLSCPTST